MISCIKLILDASPDQRARLNVLQAEFALACSHVSVIACENKCLNRVTLHHLAYRGVRERFPQLGAQMACNAIYSVSRTYRALLKQKNSPWGASRFPGNQIPKIIFAATAPVYFDRHTLSLRDSVLSMFTLDGRLHLRMNLSAADQQSLKERKVREILLFSQHDKYQLHIWLDDKLPLPEADFEQGEWPEYLLIAEPGSSSPVSLQEHANRASTHSTTIIS